MSWLYGTHVEVVKTSGGRGTKISYRSTVMKNSLNSYRKDTVGWTAQQPSNYPGALSHTCAFYQESKRMVTSPYLAHPPWDPHFPICMFVQISDKQTAIIFLTFAKANELKRDYARTL